jgi:diacylglycerol O-acyltransferase
MADAQPRAAKLSRRMSAQDASFIYGESNSGPLHIGSINIFDGQIDYDELIAHMGARMHLLPRYRQRLAFVPLNLAHATLEDDADFDLRNHLRQIALPDGADERTLLAAAMGEFAPMLERKRPLWEMILFHGLEGRRSAVLWKVHHCLVDGVSGMELLSITLDVKPDAPAPEPPERPFEPGRMPGQARRLADATIDLIQGRLDEGRRLGDLLEAPGKAARRAAALANIAGRIMQMVARPIVAAPWNAGLVTAERSLAYLKVPFADLRDIRNALGGTINDLVLAILSEAAARYLRHHKFAGALRPFRVGCPVNVRREGEAGALGNRVSMMFPELPSMPLAAEERMLAVMRETARIRAADEPQSLDQLLSAAEAIPPALTGLASSLMTSAFDAVVHLGGMVPGLSRMAPMPAPGINFIATNVPGAQVPLYLAGRRMIEIVGCVPLGANLGYSVAIVSYNHNLIFGMMAEPHLMPDVERMRDFAGEAFAELRAAAQRKADAAA